MYEDFKKWISGLKIQPDDTSAKAKWGGVTDAASEATTDTVIDLMAIVFAVSKIKPDPKTVESFLATIKANDDTFIGTGADTEIRLLAASTLAKVMAGNGALAAWTAMAVTTSFFDGRRTLSKFPVPLEQIARDRLRMLAGTIAQRPTFSPAKVVSPKPLAAPEDLDGATLTKLVNTAMTNAVAAVSSVADQHNKAMASYEGYLKRQDEDLQVLWWVIGQRCRTLEVPFDKMKPEQRPLILGGELSELIEHLPGPPSTKAILSRAGLKDTDKVSLAEAIAACGSEWVGENSSATPSPLVFPIHFAITRSAEVDGDQWVAAYKATTGIDAVAAVGALTVAQQYLFENLMLDLGA